MNRRIIMSKQYIVGMEMLEVGSEILSDHLSWLIRSAISKTTQDINAVHSLVYNNDCPKDVWGTFYAPSRSIIINMDRHVEAVLSNMQDIKYMNTSIRVIILHELLDTAMHEAYHARACTKNMEWEVGSINEEEANEYALDNSWAFAENWDVNIDEFGPFIDEFLADIYRGLKEDVKEVNCKTWKRLQFHMLDNQINYYNPDKGLEIRTIREVFEAQVQPNTAWKPVESDNFNVYKGLHTEVESLVVQEPVPVEVVPTPVTPTVVTPTVVTPTAEPVAQPTYAEGYDPLDDISCETINEEDEYVPPSIVPTTASAVPSTPVAPVVVPVAPVVPSTQPVQAAQVIPTAVPVVPSTQPSLDVKNIQDIAEKVMRRMFHHVYSKCEFNTAGGFNNPSAVLEPISIQDIEGATELFTQQDTLDAQGIFSSHSPVNGMIKGLPTAKGLPRYTFYLNIGGNIHKRVFIVQNPEKKNAQGMPTAWATKVQNGNKLMMLIADNMGITAHAELTAGLPLGQEQFTIWSNKK
jgi:hypothetical protein